MDYYNGNRGMPETEGKNYFDLNFANLISNGYIGMENGAPVQPQQNPGQNQQGYLSGMQQQAYMFQGQPTQMAMPAPDPVGPEMQQFMEEGYLMGPNCFDSSSKVYENQLLEYIRDEYHDSLYYQILARRAPTAEDRRALMRISSDEMRHSKRWGAAYFIITDKRYIPSRTSLPPVTVPSNYSQALRERYMAESRDAIKYRQFAGTTTDRCLRRLALEVSDDERQHAQELLRMMQRI